MKAKTQPILSIGQDAKTVKGEKLGFRTAIVYLAPFNLSGFNVCRCASKGCIDLCLNTSGMGIFDNVQQPRIQKTKRLFEHRAEFLAQLIQELTKFVAKCAKDRVTPAVRLNGTSDLDWHHEELGNIPSLFPTVQFYDYTKVGSRMAHFVDSQKNGTRTFPKNWHLTFSRSESNEETCIRFLAQGATVSVVFDTKKGESLPKYWEGFPVIDGDEHDARFTDRPGHVVGLRAKGKAKAKGLASLRSTFVVSTVRFGKSVNGSYPQNDNS
jgi:hypothetical protein